MSDRGFKGIWIPKSVWLSKALTLLEKVFLAEIDSLDNPPKGCTASNAYFGEFFGLTPDYASKQIRKLEAKGLIVSTFDSNSHRTIRISAKGKMFIAEVIPDEELERKDSPKKQDAPPSPNELGGVVQTNYPPSPNELGGVVQTNEHITKRDNKEDNKEDNTVAASPPRGTKSCIPSLVECQAYFAEKGWSKDAADQFWHYWESVGWKRQGKTMMKWKAAAFQWDKKSDKPHAPGASDQGGLSLQERYQKNLAWLKDD